MKMPKFKHYRNDQTIPCPYKPKKLRVVWRDKAGKLQQRGFRTEEEAAAFAEVRRSEGCEHVRQCSY